MLKGIDVSKHQGTIKWDKVKAAGIDFAMLRAGYGRSNIDSQFKRNIAECNRLDIPCGIYWFSYALTEQDAVLEAEAVLKLIKPYRVEYPVVFDLEYDTIRYAKQNGVKIDKALATKMARAFLSTIEKAGYYAMNYANLDYIRNMFEPDLRAKYDLWYAQYSNNMAAEIGSVGIWQYTSSGRVDGIVGNVDMNYAYRDYKAIITKAGLNGLKKESKINVTIETTLSPGELVESLNKAGFKASEV